MKIGENQIPSKIAEETRVIKEMDAFEFKEEIDKKCISFIYLNSLLNFSKKFETHIKICKEIYKTNERNFIRKWGSFPQTTTLMNPIIIPKYQIGIVIKNCNHNLLFNLEPFCDRVYVDSDVNSYIESEQKNTTMNMHKRCYSINSEVSDNIEIRIDGTTFNNNDFNYIMQIPQILRDSGDIGSFELGNLQININSLETYQNNLIINKEKTHEYM